MQSRWSNISCIDSFIIPGIPTAFFRNYSSYPTYRGSVQCSTVYTGLRALHSGLGGCISWPKSTWTRKRRRTCTTACLKGDYVRFHVCFGGGSCDTEQVRNDSVALAGHPWILAFASCWVAVKELKSSYHNGYT